MNIKAQIQGGDWRTGSGAGALAEELGWKVLAPWVGNSSSSEDFLSSGPVDCVAPD